MQPEKITPRPDDPRHRPRRPGAAPEAFKQHLDRVREIAEGPSETANLNGSRVTLRSLVIGTNAVPMTSLEVSLLRALLDFAAEHPAEIAKLMDRPGVCRPLDPRRIVPLARTLVIYLLKGEAFEHEGVKEWRRRALAGEVQSVRECVHREIEHPADGEPQEEG